MMKSLQKWVFRSLILLLASFTFGLLGRWALMVHPALYIINLILAGLYGINLGLQWRKEDAEMGESTSKE